MTNRHIACIGLVAAACAAILCYRMNRSGIELPPRHVSTQREPAVSGGLTSVSGGLDPIVTSKNGNKDDHACVVHIRVVSPSSSRGLPDIDVLHQGALLGSTDENGAVTVRLAHGRARIALRPSVAQTSTVEEEIVVPVTASRMELVYEFHLQRIHGTVLDDYARVLPSTRLRATGGGRDSEGRMVRVDARTSADGEGRFELTLLRVPGVPCDLFASLHGYRMKPMDNLAWTSAELQVCVRMTKEEFITGVVTDEAGRGVPGVGVFACADPPDIGIWRSSGAFEISGDGSFAIEFVAGRRYFVSAVAPGFARACADLGVLGSPPEHPVRLVLPQGDTIAGQLVDDSLKPICSARLSFVRDDHPGDGPLGRIGTPVVDGEVITDEGGRFIAPFLSRGVPYEIRVSPTTPDASTTWVVDRPTRVTSRAPNVIVVARKR